MSARTPTRKINVTKDYRLFTRSEDNRPTDQKKHGRLVDSMKEYGFLPCFPIVCRRDEKGRLVVKDGQHRLMIAESLGLPVYWVEESVDFNIATINTTARVWAIADYAKMFSKKGLHAYQDCLDFSSAHDLPIGMAVALLSGTTSWGNVKDDFLSGRFKVKDRKWADSVASIYVPIVALSGEVKNGRFLEACMADAASMGSMLTDCSTALRGAEKSWFLTAPAMPIWTCFKRSTTSAAKNSAT